MKSSQALEVNFPEEHSLSADKKVFQRYQELGAEPTQELVFSQDPPQTISPRASRLWWAPHWTHESAEISKYWLWLHVSGCCKGREKVWAREKLGRTSRRKTVTASTEKVHRDAIVTPIQPPTVTKVQTLAGAHSPPHQPLRQLYRIDWTTPACSTGRVYHRCLIARSPKPLQGLVTKRLSLDSS